MKKNYRKIEAMLSNYNRTKCKVNDLNIELRILKNTYRGIGAIVYDQPGTSKTNKIQSIVEDEVIRKEKQIESLENQILKNQSQVDKIDNALSILSEREKQIVSMRCFEGLSNKEVARIFNMTEQWASSLKTDAIYKLIEILV